jgi:repressor of nif and glnA expression
VKYDEYQAEDARLVILKELALQADGRLNEALLEKVLDAFGYLRSREWIRTQMRKLEEIGAIQITAVGTVLVAAITRAGLDHVNRRTALDGVARPSPGN